MATKTTLPEPHLYKLLKAQGCAEGEARGEARTNLANARKMAEHGIPWGTITDITGIRLQDLSRS